MSTKIYTGIALPRLSTKNAMLKLGKERPAIQKLVDRKNLVLHGNYLTNLIDRAVLKVHQGFELSEETQKLLDETPAWTTLEQLRKRQETCRRGHERDPAVDCDVELFLYMLPTTGRVMGFFQEERVGARDHLLTVDGIVDYSYWNNTDQPEEVSARQWNKRGKDWRMVDAEDTPIFSMKWQPSFVMYDDIKGHLPSFEERVQFQAREFFTDRYLRDNLPPQKPGDYSMGPVMRLMRQAREKMVEEGSEEYLLFQKMVKEFSTVMPQDPAAVMNTKLKELLPSKV